MFSSKIGSPSPRSTRWRTRPGQDPRWRTRSWESASLATLLLLTSALWVMPWLAGCSAEPEKGQDAAADRSPGAVAESRPLVVYAVNYPLSYFAERIGGEQLRVEFPAPSDVDPAFWIPDAETLVAYQSADLVLLNGAGYAKWAISSSLVPSRTVDCSAGFAEHFIIVEGAVTHSHGSGGEHAHGDLAFTTWLAPSQAVEQAEAIRKALAGRRPSHADAFDAAFAALKDELEVLDRRLAAAVATNPSMALIGSHPVYQYLGRRYDMRLLELHWEPDQLPSTDQWREFESLRSADFPAEWMMWEKEPLDETRASLLERGIESFVFDPCANRPGNGDYMTVMNANATGLERAYGAD